MQKMTQYFSKNDPIIRETPLSGQRTNNKRTGGRIHNTTHILSRKAIASSKNDPIIREAHLSGKKMYQFDRGDTHCSSKICNEPVELDKIRKGN
jgi:hypothetical protein